MVFLIGTVRSALKSSFSRVVWRWGRIVAWLRTCFGRTLVLQDHRGLFYEIEYGEPFTELAGIPRSRREFTDDPEVLDFLE